MDFSLTDTFKDFTDPVSNFLNPAIGQVRGGGRTLGRALIPTYPDPSAEMRQQEEERQRRIAESTGAINSQFGQFDDPYFTNIADSYKKFQMPLFQEQSSKARRELPYSYASSDSAEYLRKKEELERDIQRNEAQINDQANDFANTQRGQVETNRSDLVQMANSGTEAGTVAQMANTRAAALARPPTFTPIGDLFQKYTAVAANAPQAYGAYAPYQQRPLLFQPQPGYNGGGGSGSVRTIGA
jgi:hypothetical protein